MVDDNTRKMPQPNETAPSDATPPAPPRKKSRPGKSGGASAARRASARIDRRAPQHQARVLAMLAVFEHDLTGHGLDDILQHLGEQERTEHRDYYARVGSETRKAIEEIGFLARNASGDSMTDPVQRFRDATGSVLGAIFAAPEPEGEEGDLPDENLVRNRTGVEAALQRVLEQYRNRAQASLQQALAGGQAVGDESGPDGLVRLEADATRALETTLTREERSSRETVMELLGRTVKLARGVDASRTGIDPFIEKAAPAFPIPQIASIDRAVLRIAVYELLFEPDVPFKAAINEGVEIAKHYGGPNSGKFVNGVLRTISEGLPASRTDQSSARSQGRTNRQA